MSIYRIKSQVNFPNYTKNHAILFLHACYWDKVAAKSALQKYASIHASSPDIFDNRDPMHPYIQKMYDMWYVPNHISFCQKTSQIDLISFIILFFSQMISMPKTTPEGYKMLIYRLVDTDPSKVHFDICIKGFCMFNDIQLSQDLLAEGYIVIFDMKGVKLGHITRVQFGPLRAFMAYIQEAHPARLKKIIICHAASFINQIMALVRPLIKSELMSLLHFTTKGPQTLFAKELLPKVCLLKFIGNGQN